MKKISPAYYGVMLALALILSYVETLIPFYFGIPGVKLGLTNLIVVLILYTTGPVQALVLSIARIILSGFLFGNMAAILYSMAGGMLSLLCMTLAKKSKKFSIVGVSMVGGIFHNVGQIIVAMLIVENVKLVLYLPILLISGVITGFLIGIVSGEVYKRIPKGSDRI